MIGWILAGCSALILLHLVEPNLPLAWSFSGLSHQWGSPVPALLVAGIVMLAVATAWTSGVGRRGVPRVSPVVAVAATITAWLVLSIVGLLWPAPDVCPDAMFLPHQLQIDGPGSVRWLLSVPLLQLAFTPFRGLASPETFMRVTNALFSSISLLLTFAIAVRIGRSIREVAAVVLLTWTAFGSAQLTLGYTDIYPLVQLLIAAYLWTALRYLDGDGKVTWPVSIGVLGPCFYIGLILLAPSLLLLAWTALRRGELTRLAAAVVVATLFVGLATIPTFGAPFAITPWLERLSDVRIRGMNPDGQTLPVEYILSLRHAGEVLSTLVLLDGTGVVLASTLAPRSIQALFLWSILVSGLAFVVTMDPLWGPYSDWDLFSYLTLPLSIAGAQAFITWSRAGGSRPGLAGVVLGVALATSTVHLMARLNTMDAEYERHIQASPYHIPNIPNAVFPPGALRSVPSPAGARK